MQKSSNQEKVVLTTEYMNLQMDLIMKKLHLILANTELILAEQRFHREEHERRDKQLANKKKLL